MKQIGIGALTLFALLVIIGLLRGPQPAHAQDEQQMGWLEGTLLSAEGKPAPGSNFETSIKLLNKNGEEIAACNPDPQLGGLYTFRNIKPGLYEVRVHPLNLEGNRPIRVFGVVVKAGVRTPLNLRHKEGKEIDEFGQPAVPTQPVIIISQELARLQQQIDELKKKNP